MIEFRGLGLKRDTAEERQTRINHHNSIWGPFGRNLHEDLIGVQGQGTTMLTGSEPRRILHGRHENQTIHDENGMRHYYEEWGRWMNRMPSNPEQPFTECDVGCCGIGRGLDGGSLRRSRRFDSASWLARVPIDADARAAVLPNGE